MQHGASFWGRTSLLKLPENYLLEGRKKTQGNRRREALYSSDVQDSVQIGGALINVRIAEQYLIYTLDVVTKSMPYGIGELVGRAGKKLGALFRIGLDDCL